MKNPFRRAQASNAMTHILPGRQGLKIPKSRLQRLKRDAKSLLAPEFNVDPEHATTRMPKVLWIELTSKCPYDCIFCTRKTRFGLGRHLEFGTFKSLIGELEGAEFIGLNYSGESIYYPRLLEAIELANSTGASTELVTAFSSISKQLLEGLVSSGLDRLAVSLHTMDSQQYRDIYRFSSLELLKERIDDFCRIKRSLGSNKPRLDFCFVVISENLDQLVDIVRYAGAVGAAEVFVHPVIGRHPVSHDFSRELIDNRLQESFKSALRQAVSSARISHPQVPITVLNPEINPNPKLGCSPAYFAPRLPPEARIHSCDQSPLESVHILANGDVVVCEVHDEMPMGNLSRQSLREIWQSASYREFRRRCVTAEIDECRECVWKLAYLPTRWKSAIGAADGATPQFLRGWYLAVPETLIWSRSESLLALGTASRGTRLRLVGILPRAPAGESNELRIACNRHIVGTIGNPGKEEMHFDECFPVRAVEDILHVEFSTRFTFRPVLWGVNSDTRDLGFALERIEILP